MTLIVDQLETFPNCPTFGFTVEPRYLVKAIEREGGYERVDKRWSRPLNFYTAVPTGDRPEDDIQTLLYFWHAVGGQGGVFRFKDWVDYRSAKLGTDITPLDQPFEVVSGSPGGYRLIKKYTHGALTQIREIYKPKGSTIRVANTLGAEQDSSKWLLDETAGLLTTLGGFVGTPGSWGGEFDVYARFTSDISIIVNDQKVQNATLTLRERRPNE